MLKIDLMSSGALNKLKTQHQEDPNSTVLVSNKPALLRSLFTVGALCRHFDFDREEFKGNNKVCYLNLVLAAQGFFQFKEVSDVLSVVPRSS